MCCITVGECTPGGIRHSNQLRTIGPSSSALKSSIGRRGARFCMRLLRFATHLHAHQINPHLGARPHTTVEESIRARCARWHCYLSRNGDDTMRFPRLMKHRMNGVSCMKLLVAAATVISTAPVYAQSTTTGVLNSVGLNSSIGNFVFISINAAKSSNPACDTSTTWGYVLPLANTPPDNQLLAMLLSARTTQTPITLTGSGDCGVYPGIETLVGITY